MQQIGSKQAHAAGEIKANTTPRNGTSLTVCCGTTTNREAIAPVNIGHTERIPYNTRQGCDIGYLLQSIIVLKQRKEFVISIHNAGHAHTFFETLRNAPAIGVDAL